MGARRQLLTKPVIVIAVAVILSAGVASHAFGVPPADHLVWTDPEDPQLDLYGGLDLLAGYLTETDDAVIFTWESKEPVPYVFRPCGDPRDLCLVDVAYHWSIALGSHDEVGPCLDVVVSLRTIVPHGQLWDCSAEPHLLLGTFDAELEGAQVRAAVPRADLGDPVDGRLLRVDRKRGHGITTGFDEAHMSEPYVMGTNRLRDG